MGIWDKITAALAGTKSPYDPYGKTGSTPVPTPVTPPVPTPIGPPAEDLDTLALAMYVAAKNYLVTRNRLP